MFTEPRVVFRVEPEKPVFQQAVQDIDYGNPMEEADVATIQAALQNILDLFIPALKKTSGDGQPFLSCFKNKANFPIVIAILKRCETIIRYCLRQDTQQFQRSPGTVRFIKGSTQRANRKRCGIVGAQAGKTIWLYEAWWKAPSLRCAKGIRPEKRHNGRMLDALADAFMQTQEGSLFHETVHLASRGQMRYLISPAYPPNRLPSSLLEGPDLIGDTSLHEHVNQGLSGEAIIDIKYRRPRRRGGLDWEAAYHLDGAQDLASLRNGDVGSVLNADSYNAFAALALTRRVQAKFAEYLDASEVHVGIPNLHPDTVNRLLRAISNSPYPTHSQQRSFEGTEGRKKAREHKSGPVAAGNGSGSLSNLGFWPTPVDAAALQAMIFDGRCM